MPISLSPHGSLNATVCRIQGQAVLHICSVIHMNTKTRTITTRNSARVYRGIQTIASSLTASVYVVKQAEREKKRQDIESTTFLQRPEVKNAAKTIEVRLRREMSLNGTGWTKCCALAGVGARLSVVYEKGALRIWTTM